MIESINIQLIPIVFLGSIYTIWILYMYSQAFITVIRESIEDKFNRVWNEDILPKCKSVRYLDKMENPTLIPTSRIEILDSNGNWLLDYNYSTEYNYFIYSSQRVHNILKSKVSKDIKRLEPLIKQWAETNLNLKDTMPMCKDDYATFMAHLVGEGCIYDRIN